MLALGREGTSVLEDDPEERLAIMHENVRGPEYYQ
jgi:hypothetical protein